MKKKLVSVLLAAALALTLCFGTAGTTYAASNTDIKAAMDQTADYLYTTVKGPSFGSTGGEWLMYALSRAGYDMDYSYIEAYKKAVEYEVGKTGGVLHEKKYTEYSRVIIAYTALGLDPTNIGGYNMVEKLADFDKVVWQGINGPIFALRALDSGNYDEPKAEGVTNPTTRQKLIDHILDLQLADGGWALGGAKADPDITGMALESLAPYYSQSKVKTAIGKAVQCLSELQNSYGGYGSWGTANAESCAQVICGLVSVGINPNTNSKFKKNGKSVVDGLLGFFDEKTGGFRHVNTASGGYEPAVNLMATEQACYGLAKYYSSVPTQKLIILKTARPKKASLSLTWLKTDIATGYQVKIATNSKFTKSVKNLYYSAKYPNANITKTVTGLKSGKTYYVKVRAYQTVCGNKMYGPYSSYKKVTVK